MTGSLDLCWTETSRKRRHVFGYTRAEAAAKLDALRRLHEAGLPIPDDVQSFLNREAASGCRPAKVQMLHGVLRTA